MSSVSRKVCDEKFEESFVSTRTENFSVFSQRCSTTFINGETFIVDGKKKDHKNCKHKKCATSTEGKKFITKICVALFTRLMNTLKIDGKVCDGFLK
jgi:hypothetical protein